MVFHKCLFCTDGLQIKKSMLTRRKRQLNETSSQVLRSKQKTEIADSSKGKKTMFSKEQPRPVKKNPSGKDNASLNAPNPEISRKRKRDFETAVINKEKKLKVSQKNQKKKNKIFCWICRKPCQTRICACSRVYHPECLVKVSKEFDGNICPECQLKSVDGTELSRPFTDALKVYLKCVVDWITEKYKHGMFMSWPQNPGNNKIVPAIDIQTLTEKVQNDAYKSTSDFYSDAKWIYHNTCILYGEKSKELMESKKLIKDVKEELMDMEACPECYYYLYCELLSDDGDFDEDPDTTKNLSYEKSFVRLCNPPHDIVWAKVSGYSHWPAKCLKVVNGRAHVRFFGKHEKSDIPIDTIFHISKEHPVYDYRNITDTDTRTSLDYTYAKREFLRYKALYEKNIGEFRFFKFREFYNTETDNFQIEKNFEHQKKIARQNSQLELPSSTNSTSIPCISETTVADTHPEIILSDTFSNDISIDMIFSVNGCRAKENADNGNTISTNPTPRTDFSEQSLSKSYLLNSSSISTGALSEIQIKEELSDLMQTQQVSSDTEPCNGSATQFMEILKNALNNSSTSMEFENITQTSNFLASILQKCVSPTSTHETFPAMPLPNTFLIKKESNLCPTESVSTPSQMHELKEGNSTNVTECPTDSVSSPSQMYDLNEGNSANVTECPTDFVSSPSQIHELKEGNSANAIECPTDIVFSPSPMHELKEGNSTNVTECPTDSVSSPSQMYKFIEGNSANVSEYATVTVDNDQQIFECEAVPCSSSKEIAVIDLTADDDNIDTSSSTLSKMLMENPQMCQLFLNAHQTLQTLLTRLCVETCKQQRTDSHRRCEAFNNKLNETERRFHDETEKLRDEIKCLQMSLASEKEKNTQS